MSSPWICSVCGYIHKGDAPPDECPSCGAPFTAFAQRERDPLKKFRAMTVSEERPVGCRYVIIGNSGAGRAAARAIGALDDDAQITIITEEACDIYSRPMLPDYIGGIEESDLFAVGSQYRVKGAQLVLGETVAAIDREARKVHLASGGEVAYDLLLLATGSDPIEIPWPGSEGERIGYFRRFSDAQRISQWARDAKHAVVVGGGLLGLEFVRAFHERGVGVTHLVREARVGAPALDEEAGALLEAALADWGVELALQEEVESFQLEDGQVCGVKTSKGRTIACDVVGIAVGARPRIELAQQAGLACDRGVLVDNFFRTSDADIYVAGDAAQAFEIACGEQRVVTSWRNAQEQGEFAGACMAGVREKFGGALAVNFQLAAGLPFCAIGESNPRAPEGFEIEVEIDARNRTYQKTVRRNGQLVGAALVGELGAAASIEQEIRNMAGTPPETTKELGKNMEADVTREVESKEAATVHKMTEDNLKDAFAGESQAHMKYLNFAAVADKEGMANIARLFKAASYAEQVHASKHLDVLDGIGSTAENLGDAMGGENFEVEEMYPAYLAVAEDQGEDSAYQTFNRAYQVEQQHHEFYAQAKEAADSGNDAELGDIVVCSICGCTLEGEAPAKCPVCGAPKTAFQSF